MAVEYGEEGGARKPGADEASAALQWSAGMKCVLSGRSKGWGELLGERRVGLGQGFRKHPAKKSCCLRVTGP